MVLLAYVYQSRGRLQEAVNLATYCLSSQHESTTDENRRMLAAKQDLVSWKSELEAQHVEQSIARGEVEQFDRW